MSFESRLTASPSVSLGFFPHVTFGWLNRIEAMGFSMTPFNLVPFQMASALHDYRLGVGCYFKP
jgi:hypothetical protein